jgi:hypothetical protein
MTRGIWRGWAGGNGAEEVVRGGRDVWLGVVLIMWF